MPRNTSQAAADAGDEIDGREHPRTIKRFGKRPQIPKTPHVQRNVNESDMQEHAGDQTPPVSCERQACRVRAPVQQFGSCGIGDRNSGERHTQVHCDVDSENSLGDGPACARADPGGGHYSLDSILCDFPTLRGFVLHTPRAQPFTKS